MGGTERNQIYKGLEVMIVLKNDQATGKLTKGIVKDILDLLRNYELSTK